MLKLNNELIKEYERLVYSIIKNYATESNKEDLFQEGMMGLIDASKTYKEGSTKFSSFAYMHILGRVLKYIREDRNMKIGRDLIKDYKRVLLLKEQIYKSYGRPASEEDICRILKMDKSRLNEVLLYNEKELSLNKVVSDEEKNIELEDTIYNKEEIDKLDMFDLKEALSNLSKEERDLIYKRYYENMTQAEIAKENSTSQVKIYRYERRILDKLKDKIMI